MTGLKDLTWPAADFSRVPFGVFTDPDIYEMEQERIFKGPVWIYLALEAEIANPGDFLVTYVGDTPVVVNRAEDGSIHAWVNRCAHRGTMVVREPRGNRESHTCVYHHWCYDLEGNLIGVPFQKGSQGQGGMPESFRKEDHGLQKYRVATYKGAIFGASHPGVEPLEDFLGPRMREFLDYMFREPIEILGYMRQRMPANWKIYYENLMDGWHGGLLHQLPVIFGIHRVTQAGGGDFDQHKRHVAWRVIHGSDDEESVHEGYDETTLMNEAPTLNDPCIVDWRDEQNDGRILNMMAIFPSVLFQQLSNTLATRQIRPTGPDEFELYWTYFGYVGDDAELRKMRMQQANLVGPAGLISLEDGEAGVLIQRAIRRQREHHSLIAMGGTGPIESQDHLVTEVPVRAFWKTYCDLMGISPEAQAAAAE